MQRSTPLLLLLSATAVTLLLWYWLKSESAIELGIFDPQKAFILEERITLQNGFFGWYDQSPTLENFLKETKDLGRIPLVTLEPWQNPAIGDDNNLLKDISNGKYDETIDTICQRLSSSEQVIWIRWGHEMEHTTKRYPWAGGNPEGFVTAYRRFVDRCREKSQNFVFVWSPAGDAGLEPYWPGEKYVDYVGISLFSFEAWEVRNGGTQRSFADILGDKYARVKNFGRPILIAEMGVTGTDEQKRSWMEAGAASLRRFPLLKAAIYFNSQDVEGAWGAELPTPDWRISPQALLPMLEKTEKTAAE